jgi:hypothetical protein
MEPYTRAEQLGAWVALVFSLGMLVIAVDVITGGWLLGGPVGDEDQAVNDDSAS